MSGDVWAVGVGTGDLVAQAHRSADRTGAPVQVHFHLQGEPCGPGCHPIEPNLNWGKSLQEQEAEIEQVGPFVVPVDSRYEMHSRNGKWGYRCRRQGCLAWYGSLPEARRLAIVHVTLAGGCW